MSKKVVVITGAGGVLCSTLAKAFGKSHRVALLDLNKVAAEKVAQEIKNDGGSAIGLQADVLDKSSLENARNQILDKFGPCDVLINGAGGNHPLGTTTEPYFEEEDFSNTREDFKSFFDLDMNGIQFTFNLNFIGTLLPTQVFTKDMVGREGCNILNISSMSGFAPLTKIPAYSGAKAAVSNFTQWLAVHFSKVGIRVNAIAPGFFLTEQNRTLLTNSDGSLTPRGTTILDQTPMRMFGKPQDLVGPVLWLCGESASFVTGINMPIDGGFSAFNGV